MYKRQHIGRVKVFTISCVCYGLAQLSLGFSSSELMVLISRGAAGAFAGGAGVATMAYVIDVSEPSKRAANLAVYTATVSYTHLGDTFATDIIGAYRAGMQPIWIFANPGQQCQADLPRIYRIEELLDLL